MTKETRNAEEIARTVTANGNVRAVALKIEDAIRTAVEAEREACAEVADRHAMQFRGGGMALVADEIASSIRRRSEQTRRANENARIRENRAHRNGS